MSAFSPGCPRVFQTWLEFHELWGKKTKFLIACKTPSIHLPTQCCSRCVCCISCITEGRGFETVHKLLALITLGPSSWTKGGMASSKEMKEINQGFSWWTSHFRPCVWQPLLLVMPIQMLCRWKCSFDSNLFSSYVISSWVVLFTSCRRQCYFKLGGSFQVMSTPMSFQVVWLVCCCCVGCVLCRRKCYFKLCGAVSFMLFSKLCGYTCYFKLCGYTSDFKLCRSKIVYPVVSIGNSISSCVDSNVISSCVETNVISSCADTNVVSNLLTQVSIANSCYVDAHVNKLLSC